MIYSTWWEGGLRIDGALLRRLAELPNVEAVKWSAPSYDAFTEGMAAIADRLVVIDNQAMHAWGHLLGAAGFVTHISNFWPEYPLGIWRCLEAGDYAAARDRLATFKWAWSAWAGQGRGGDRRRGAVHQAGARGGRPGRRTAAPAIGRARPGADRRAARALRGGRRPARDGGRLTMASGDPIVVLDGYPLDAAQRARLEGVSDRLRVIHRPIDDQETIDGLDEPEVEVLLGEYVPTDLQRLPRLRWVQYSGAGVDPLTDQAPWANGVLVTTASGGNSVAIGEYVLGWLLHLSQQIGELLENRKHRTWATTRLSLGGRALRGRTLAIVGYGSVGREVARLAQAFGMRILAAKARPDVLVDEGFRIPGTGDPDGSIPERIVGFDRLGEVVREADYVLVAAPLTPATRGVLGAAVLEALQPHAWFINVGRGDLFDEAAVIEAARARAVRRSGARRPVGRAAARSQPAVDGPEHHRHAPRRRPR